MLLELDVAARAAPAGKKIRNNSTGQKLYFFFAGKFASGHEGRLPGYDITTNRRSDGVESAGINIAPNC